MTTMITYETLYDILRREKTTVELQKLEDSFYQDVSRYKREKEKVLEKQESQVIEKQISNINKILEELYEKREKKIITLAISHVKTEEEVTINILPEEKDLYNNIVKALKEAKQHITKTEDKIVQNNKKVEETPKTDLKMIRILKPIPQFVDTNLNAYGPFNKEYITNLPRKIADLLIKNNKAEEIKTQ